MKIEQSQIDELIIECRGLIGETLEGSEQDSLKLEGGEEVLQWIAEKVVLPMLAGIISKALFQLWKKITTKSEAKEVVSAVLASHVTNDSAAKSDILHRATEALVEEGVNEAVASRAAERIFEVVRGSVENVRP